MWARHANWEDLNPVDWAQYADDNKAAQLWDFTTLDWRPVYETLQPYFSSTREVGGILTRKGDTLHATITAIGDETPDGDRAGITVREQPALILFHTHPSGSEPLPSFEDCQHALFDTLIGRYAINVVINERGWSAFRVSPELLEKIRIIPVTDTLMKRMDGIISGLTDNGPVCGDQLNAYKEAGFLMQHRFYKKGSLCWNIDSNSVIPKTYDIMRNISPDVKRSGHHAYFGIHG